MGFLDDLKKRADDQKAKDHAEEKRRQELERIYREEILPKMQLIYGSLFEMAEHLNYVKFDVSASYALETYGALEGMKQSAYSVSTDSRDNMTSIVLAFWCTGDGRIEIPVIGKRDIDRYSEYLRIHRLAYKTRMRRDTAQREMGADFIVENKIPVEFEFKVDIETSTIVLRIFNFERLGARTIRIRPQEVDRAFVDRLAEYVVRERDDFVQIEMDEDKRRQIREQLEREKQFREQELAMAEQLEAQQREPGDRGFLNRLMERAKGLQDKVGKRVGPDRRGN
jgi:hypothetical protein